METSVHLSVSMRATPLAALNLVMMGCTGVGAMRSEPVPEVRPGYLAGYLQQTALPNSLALVPPPPAAGSPAFAADERAYRSTRALRDTPRWALAVKDANLKFPDAASAFACAAGAEISEAESPHLYVLLRRTLMDGGLATYTAKNHYQRQRPFVAFKETSCTPQEEAMLAKDGSYPSGHSAVGWTWALILSELAPDRANAILQRGYAFGQSRVICGVHWQSDVTEGRVVAAGAVARLHADSAFNADLQAAKKELAAAQKKALAAPIDCTSETTALAMETPR
jgi:acid phosphatase (class A)